MMAGQLDVQKFSEELHWCIGQLELGLQRQSPDSRQAAETVKLLKILRSNKAPMVKKRQVMRNAFGDYRKKMKDAEKKCLSGLRHSRFQPQGSAKAPASSRFLKMSRSKQNAGLVRDELNKNLGNLILESPGGPGIPGAQIPPEVASSQAAELDHQALCPSDGLPVSSNGAVLENTPVFGLTESDLVTCTEGLQGSSAENPSSAIGSGLPPASSSSTCGRTNGLTDNSQTLAAASSNCGHGEKTKEVSGFKYEPSDNSFVFGFESLGQGDGQEIGEEDSGISGSEAGHLVVAGCDKAAYNGYKYEKSVNEFRFNFTPPDDV